jgi:2-dehydro-3-deoxygluconokinase
MSEHPAPSGGEPSNGTDVVCVGETMAVLTPAEALAAGARLVVGAGGASAAGFLSGLLDGLSVERRLRPGHAVAGAVLRSPGDTLEEPPGEAAGIRGSAGL